MTAIHFEAPYWLVLAVLPALLIPRRRRPGRRTRPSIVDPALEAWSIRAIVTGGPRRLFWPIAWVSLVAALADPYGGPPDGQGVHRVIDLATVVDISPSMSARDIDPDRLGRAVREWRAIVERLPPARTSLVAFSAEAYPLLPLTTDLDVVGDYLAALAPTMTRRLGSNLAQALETAARSLEDSPPGSRAILVLSDGEIHAPESCERIARRLGEKGLPVFVLGLGSGAGVPIDDGTGRLRRDPATGRVHLTRLDASTLRAIARHAGGIYRTATGDDRDSEALAAGLSRLSPHPLERNDVARRRRFAPWAIGLAIACLAAILWWPMLRARPGDGL